MVTDLGVPPDTVVLAMPGSVLKTSSGKVRRTATRAAYVAGTLGRRDSWLRQAGVLLSAISTDRIRQGWRTTRDLLFTARIAIVVALTSPLLWLGLRLASQGSGAIRFTGRWARTVFRLCGVRVEVEGLEHLRGLAGGLIVSNHASYVDPLVLMTALPVDLHFVAKRGLRDYPLLGLAITRAGHVTIERGDLVRRLEGADELVARIAGDEFLVIFPEGTFTRRRGLLPFRLGAFKAAVEAKAVVLPVAIRGTRDLLRDGSWLFRVQPLWVKVGEPLRPDGSGLPEIVRLRDVARSTIASGANEPPLEV
jgi:1-acyl-sn-glycerol-3-phosphate acyltransferase